MGPKVGCGSGKIQQRKPVLKSVFSILGVSSHVTHIIMPNKRVVHFVVQFVV